MSKKSRGKNRQSSQSLKSKSKDKKLSQISQKFKTDSEKHQETEGSIKSRTYHWLRLNPYVKKRGKIRKLAEFLGVNYEERKDYLYQISSEFKSNLQNGIAPRSPNHLHHFVALGYAPDCIDRKKYSNVDDVAVNAGWKLSKNKNHGLIWNDSVGRIEWFMTGRLFIHVHKLKAAVASQKLLLAKAKKCVVNAFINSGIIFREDIGFRFLNTMHEWKHESVWLNPEGRRLPYMKIDAYDKFGFKVIVGDESDPTGVEIHFCLNMYEYMMQQLSLNSQIISSQEKTIKSVMKTLTQMSTQIKMFTDISKDLQFALSKFKPKKCGVDRVKEKSTLVSQLKIQTKENIRKGDSSLVRTSNYYEINMSTDEEKFLFEAKQILKELEEKDKLKTLA